MEGRDKMDASQANGSSPREARLGIFMLKKKSDLEKGRRICFMLLYLGPGQLVKIFVSFNLQSDIEKSIMKTEL